MIEPDHVPDYALQELIVQALSERPEWRRNLQEMLTWEAEHPRDTELVGWDDEDVHTARGICSALVSMGILDKAFKSRSSHNYRLHSYHDTLDALDSIATRDPREEAITVSDLFRFIIGHENVKTILTLAIEADEPVHALLVGPPSSGKSMILADIARLPGAYLYAGSTMTKAGLNALLISVRPRFLIIEEIDKMSAADYSPLLTLMETGMVSRVHANSRVREEMGTKVFAAANDTSRLDETLIKRFGVLQIPPYTLEQFLAVSEGVLQHRLGLGPEMSRLISREVAKRSLDVRDAVRVAKMARRDPRRVDEIVNCLWPPVARTRLRPL